MFLGLVLYFKDYELLFIALPIYFIVGLSGENFVFFVKVCMNNFILMLRDMLSVFDWLLFLYGEI